MNDADHDTDIDLTDAPMKRFSFSTFGPLDLLECRRDLKSLGPSATNMEDAGQKIVRYMYESFRIEQTDSPECALVRFYVTRPFDTLPSELRAHASASAGAELSPTTRCLTLLASAGKEPEWNSRHESENHKAIPLVSEEAMQQIPMVLQLVTQLGVDVTQVVRPDPKVIVDLEKTGYNVFHVENAVGSEHIPAQEDFVIPYAIKSVLGFGGMLPWGDLFAVIAFSRVKIPAGTARMFRALTLSTELSLLSHRDAVFAPEA
jgi:hypothetical protein